MISFVPLLESDICSPSLWWDHSELADHRNGCTSLCSLQIRSMGGISAFSFCLFFTLYVLLAEWLKNDKVEIFPECWHCALPCMVHRGGGERGWKELWDKLGSCAMQLLRKQRVHGDWGFKTLRWEQAGLSACPAPACGILAAPYDFCFCLEESFLQ